MARVTLALALITILLIFKININHIYSMNSYFPLKPFLYIFLQSILYIY